MCTEVLFTSVTVPTMSGSQATKSSLVGMHMEAAEAPAAKFNVPSRVPAVGAPSRLLAVGGRGGGRRGTLR